MGFGDAWDRDLIGNQVTQKCSKARVRDPEYCGLPNARLEHRALTARWLAVPLQRTYFPGFLFVDRSMAMS
jgi:hypothetical protein